MPRRTVQLRALLLAAPTLLVLTSPVFAFEPVDLLPYPSRGRFPAYPVEPEGARPTTFYAQAGVMYDNNAFRLPDGLNARDFLGKDQKSDTILRYGGGITHEQRIFGRQSLLLSARGDYYKFMRYSQMDHSAYGLLGEWRWELGNDLGGAVGYNRAQRVMDPAEIRRPVLNYITSDRLFANAAYRLGPSFRLRGGAEGLDTERTGPTRDPLRIDSRTGVLGLDFVTPLGNTLGAEVRETRGDAPIPGTVVDALDPTLIVGSDGKTKYREREVAATATYVAGTMLRFDGRLGRTRRHYTDLPIADFEGTTYRGAVEWLPGNKTILGLEAYRAPRSIIDVAAVDVLVNGVAGTVSWAPTIKLVFTGRVALEDRKFRGDPLAAASGLPERQETAHTYRLAVGWEPRRFVELGAGIEHGTRDSNILFRDFSYTAVMANAAVRW